MKDKHWIILFKALYRSWKLFMREGLSVVIKLLDDDTEKAQKRVERQRVDKALAGDTDTR